MNHRLTVAAAVAVILASFSLFSVIRGSGWLYAGIGAVVTVALAGTLTRLAVVPAAGAATGLALIACCPLLTNPAWYWKAAGLVIVAIAAASATGMPVLRILGGLITYLAALLIYLNVVFAAPKSVAAVIPTGASVRHMWLLAGQGLNERVFAPPVPGHHGIELLAAGGIGLMAVVTDLLAVRLRSPAIAGLPLLVLFSVPVATSAKIAGIGAPIAFALGITGYLALLAVDGRERLRIWGRLVTVWQAAEGEEQVKGPDTRALAAAGRRIGLTAVCFAIVVPLVLPNIKEHGLFGKHGSPGTGGQAVTLPNPLAKMRNELLMAGKKTVLTYRTSNPRPQSQYLPVYVLNYDSSSQAFKIVTPVSDASVPVSRSHLGRPPGWNGNIVPAPSYRTTITLGALTSGLGSKLNFLPVPYAPASLKVQGDWLEDNATLMIYSGQEKLTGLKYAVTSTEPDPVPADLVGTQALPTDVRNNYLGFSSAENKKLTQIARRITKTASTPYAKAVAMETWFTTPGRFTYSLSANVANGPAGLLQFLTVQRQGFCQQFAFAMAVLARLIGIPSRIAVGYTAGTHQRNGTWKVTNADAHAWPELYFPNAGWLRFEPTPGGPAGQGTATVPPYIAGGPAASSTPGGVAPSTGSSAPPKGTGKGNVGNSKLLHPNIAVGNSRGSGAAGRGGNIASLVALIVALVLVLAAIMPWAARTVIRRRRWLTATGPAGQAHAAWLELHDDLDDYGLPCPASESPRAVARRIRTTGGLDESACQALDRIARAEERARYAAVPEAAVALSADVLTVRRALSRKVTRAARWRARLLPASTLRPVRAGLQQSLDVFGWLDAAGQKLRAQLSRDPAAGHEA
jgi:transglutaminase-like putative cysteine protease